jgi:purine-binding chemotaxis protein CheW
MSDKCPDKISGVGPNETTTSEQYLTFALGGEAFAIPILAVQEIRRWEVVTKTPRSPDHILGVMNLRGAVLPVLDLRVRLGLDACERTATSVVIVVRVETASTAERTVGCLVDGVSDVVSLASDSIRPAPAACGTIETHYLAGVATVEHRLLMLLDLVGLLESSIDARGASEAA